MISRYRRYRAWDYAKGASLFVTVSTAPRRPLFGRVAGGEVRLSALGEAVKGAIEAMPRLNAGLSLFGRAVMPDHVHFNVALRPGLDEPLKTLGNAIRRFKNYTTKLAKRSLAIRAGGACRDFGPNGQSLGTRPGEPTAASISPDGRTPGVASPGEPTAASISPDGRTAFGQFHLWQQGYHDYLLVSRSMIDSTERYIAYNPLKWSLMYGVDSRLRVVEPLVSPRLDIGDYWKGVGNTALLDPATPLVSLRVSRKVADFSRLLEKMASAADKGYAIISGFISKGEQAVRNMLCRRQGARLIRIRPFCIPNARFRPESVYATAFAEGRCLEIGRGNDEGEFGRGACLDINAEIIEIAAAGRGLAVYWQPDGPHILANTLDGAAASRAPISPDGRLCERSR